MELMVGDFGLCHNPSRGQWHDDTAMPRAFAASGWMGARRTHEIVERGPFYDTAGNPTSFDFHFLDRWVNDVTSHEMRPFVTLTNAVNGVMNDRRRLADPVAPSRRPHGGDHLASLPCRKPRALRRGTTAPAAR